MLNKRYAAMAVSLLAGTLFVAACGGNQAPGKNAMPSTPKTSSPGTSGTSGTSSSNSSTPPANTSSSAPTSSAPAFQKKYLTVNSAAKTVIWQLDGGVGAASSPFNFNGDSSGKMVLTVPTGWSVTVHFKNLGKLNHSAVITSSKTSTTPAFAGATTPTPATGTPPGAKYTFGFTPTKTGTYYVVCAVPGHVAAGMWDLIKVVASGQPTLRG